MSWDWNHGDILDALGQVVPSDAPALIHGPHTVSWADFTRRSNSLARALLATGADFGAKVAFYMRNGPAYTESFAACTKARLVHVNVNYRYQTDELAYIFDNSDAEIAIYDSAFADQARLLKDRCPKVRQWIEVSWDGATVSDFAVPYEALVTGDGSPLGIKRSGDDLFFLYTGGTTGMPKGVMWPLGTQYEALRRGASRIREVPTNMSELLSMVRKAEVQPRLIPACPLMHGTGLFSMVGTLLNGGAIVTLENRSRFDPVQLWDTVQKHSVTGICIVGDPFSRPMLDVLEQVPGKFDLSSVLTINSSGAMWSRETKLGLIKHIPQVLLSDGFGASEATGFGVSYTTKDGESRTAGFMLGEESKVFTEDGREVQPGSGEVGFVACGGPIPLGYYKDPEKTDKTYKTVDGKRYAIPGDYCRVEADGSITLLGRGSVCINTGGEKVYPEEVEEILKQHPAVRDALVVGLPDPRWGQAVTGLVEFDAGASADEDELRAHVRAHLAGYKVPKRVLVRESLGRAPNGKADYKGNTAYAKQQLGIA